MSRVKPWETDEYLKALGRKHVRRLAPLVLMTPAPPPRVRRRQTIPVRATLFAAMACAGFAFLASAFAFGLRDAGEGERAAVPEAHDLALDGFAFLSAGPDVAPPVADPAPQAMPALAAPEVAAASRDSLSDARAVAVPTALAGGAAGAASAGRPAIPVVLPPRRAMPVALPRPAEPRPLRPAGAGPARPALALAPPSMTPAAVESPVLAVPASFQAAVARMPLPAFAGDGGAAAPAQSAELRIALFFPRGSDRGEQVAEALGAAGFAVASAGPVGFRVSATHVRYYHPHDVERAAWLAGAVGGEPRDFTGFAPRPPAGTVEVWLAGAPEAVAARADATGERGLQALGGALRRLFSGPANGRPAG